MRIKYTKKATQAIEGAKSVSKALGHGYVGSEHLLLAIVSVEDSTASKVLDKYGVTQDKVLEMIERTVAPSKKVSIKERDGFSPRARRILESGLQEAERFGDDIVGTEHILMAILADGDCVGNRLLCALNVNVQKAYADIVITMGGTPAMAKDRFKNNRMSPKNSNLLVDRYSTDLTQIASLKRLDPVIGRNNEIRRIIQILSRRTKNNPCLVGEPGVGKTAVVEGLANAIASGNVPEDMLDKRLLSLDLSSVVAGSKYRGEFEERVKRIIDEVKSNRNIILFIDEIHTMIGAGGAEGSIDASNILKPALARGEVQVIGATTVDEYRKYFEKDAALERRFQPVEVKEPTVEETIEILTGIREKYEQHHEVLITDEAVKSAAELSARYISGRFLPDKAIDLIDEAASKVKLSAYNVPQGIEKLQNEIDRLSSDKEKAIKSEQYEMASQLRNEEKKKRNKLEKLMSKWREEYSNSKNTVDENDVAAVVSEWTKIPVKKLEQEESERLKKLESILHKRVIGQEEAVTAVSKSIRRGRVGLKNPKRPIGSFLFLGPTGVGKTELSKALAEVLFGKEDSIIRVDMSEYMEKHSVSKIVGSPPGYVGYEEGGQLSERVRRNPYSVILFDEIEKAHPDVFNILLQVLDDGHITDNTGRVVDFKNTVIIMTSNAGAQRIVEPKNLGFNSGKDDKQNYEIMKKNVMEEVKRLFKPEFINRIDETIVFHPLNEENTKAIADIMLKEIIDRAKKQLDITLKVTAPVKAFIAKEGYDPKYGARPLRRKIQNLIEDRLAEEILDANVKTGDTVCISLKEKQLIFSVKK